MFLIDDILLSPLKGVLWIVEKVHDAAKEEMEGESARITAELSELYMMLETGRITEAEFDAKEKILLDRLDAIGPDKDQDKENQESHE